MSKHPVVPIGRPMKPHTIGHSDPRPAPERAFSGVKDTYNAGGLLNFVIEDMLHKEYRNSIGNVSQIEARVKSWILHDVTPAQIMDMLAGVGKIFKPDSESEEMFILGSGFVVRATINQMIGRYEVRANIFTSVGNVQDVTDKIHKSLKNKIDACDGFVTVEIAWFFESKDGTRHHNLTEAFCETIHQEAYPHIPDVDAFIDEYLNSESSIMLLMGSPGSGKTRLIRYLIQRAGNKWQRQPKVVYTSDMRVLEDEWMFIEFRCEDHDFMVLEDIDDGLVSRKSGNKIVHKFLASSDGFVAARHKKIILSTNLFVKDVDEALVRPGRCFACLETTSLTPDQAAELAKALGKKDAHFDKNMTVADVYNSVYRTSSDVRMISKKFGFRKEDD